MEIKSIIHKLLTATPNELGDVIDKINSDTFAENVWSVAKVKIDYAILIERIDKEIAECRTFLMFGNETMKYHDCDNKEVFTFDIRQALTNLQIAKDVLSNPPIIPNPDMIDVNSINWNGRDIFTAEEAKALLGVSDSTYKRWVNDGWLSETQMEGSNKRWVLKEELLAFMKNEKIFKKSWR